MKPIIAILTGLHVLAHGMFGCCDHRLVVTEVAESVCACHHGHGDDTTRSGDCDTIERDTPGRAPHECAHDACHWVVGSDGPMAAPLDFSAPARLAIVPPATHSALYVAEYQPDDILGRTSAPPLRLHLALGVLVV